MQIGDKLNSPEMIRLLDSVGVVSKYADRGLDELKQNIDNSWVVNHIAYKPRSKFQVRGEPVFQFILVYGGKLDINSMNYEFLEVPVGPEVKKFVLQGNYEMYYVRNVAFCEAIGIPQEKLLLE